MTGTRISDMTALAALPATGATIPVVKTGDTANYGYDLAADLAGRARHVASRTALAALDRSQGTAAYLREAGREGSFVFSTANLSAKVTADTRQGIYVAPSSDTTGASGAWVREFDGPVHVDWFGVDGSEDGPAINAAKDVASAIGKPHIRLAAKTYNTASAVNFDVAGLFVEGYGATINSTVGTNTAAFPLTAETAIRGVRFYMTSDLPFFNIVSPNWLLIDVVIQKPEGSANIPLYFRAGADNGKMIRGALKGSNGIGVADSCKNIIIDGVDFILRATGGDDAIAIKAITSSSENWRIVNCYFENCAAFVSIGSEIGAKGTTDATYSHAVRDIVCSNNAGKNCANIALIKPGAVNLGQDAYDFRDGLVEGVVITNNTLEDPSGTKFERAIALTPGRGAKIRNIHCANNVVTGRTTAANTGQRPAVCDIYLLDSSVTQPGTAPSSVSNVVIQGRFHDPYDGAANDGSHPGYPVQDLVAVEKQNTAYGSVSSITIDVEGNGTDKNGVHILGGLDDAIFIRRARITNIGATGTTAHGALRTASRTIIGEDISVSIASGGSALPRVLDSGGSFVKISDADYTALHARHVARMLPVVGSSTPTFIGIGAATANGTAASATMANTNALTMAPRMVYTSATTANAQAGPSWSSSATVAYYTTTAARGGFEFRCRFGATAIPTGPRMFIGMTNSGFAGQTIEPSAFAQNYAVFALDSTDTNIQFLTGNGTSGAKSDTGIPFVANGLYEASIWAEPGSGAISGVLNRIDTGAIWFGSRTTNLPNAGTAMFPVVLTGLNGTDTGTAVAFNFGGMSAGPRR